MLRRLRLKFVVINMAMVTVMLGVIFGLVYHFTRVDLERENLDMMRAVALVPALARPGRPDEVSEEVRLPYFVLQIASDGAVASFGGGYYDLSDRAFLQSLADEAVSTPGGTGVLEEYALRFCLVSTPMGERLVFCDISSERSTLSGLARTCLLLGALSFLAFLGLSLVLARWAVKPVERAWQQQRQFVADASHELKTPLAVITTNAELLQGTAPAPAVEHILTTARQMRALVEGLLELARADAGEPSAPMALVDWSALTGSALLPFEPVFFERELVLTSQIQPGLTVWGQSGQLRQVVDILLDNAQKYARAPSTVSLSLARTGHDRCLLTVENQAEPLSQGELEDLFKRFFRRDRARSRDGSFGLGLAIARQILSAHRGRIWAESRGERLRFCVELPLREAAASPPPPPGAPPGAGRRAHPFRFVHRSFRRHFSSEW